FLFLPAMPFLRKRESGVVNFCCKAKLGEGENLTAVNDTGFLLPAFARTCFAGMTGFYGNG
ncbi:MAG: hypothetical protein ACR2P5_04475, partial [Gammaproteobacteria bacterium]